MDRQVMCSSISIRYRVFYDFWPFLYCPFSLSPRLPVSLMLPLWQPRYVYVRSTQGLTHICLSFSLSLLLHLSKPPGCNSKYLTEVVLCSYLAISF